MAKKNPKNKNKPFLSFLSFFLLLFALSLIFFQISKKPKEVKAVPGQLNINAVSGGVQNFNQVGIGGDVTGSSAKLYVNGNVGIGTMSPVHNFQVYRTSLVDPSLTYSTGATAGIRTEYIDIAFGAYTANPWAAWIQARHTSNQAWPLVINPLGGNVGIGTTNPATKLHIRGTQGNLVVHTESLTNSIAIEAFNDGNTVKYPILLNPWGGNVGIGTTGPSQRLHVEGSAFVTGNVGNWNSFTVGGTSANYYPVQFRNDAPGFSVSNDLMIYRSNVHTNGSWFGTFLFKLSFHSTNWGHFGSQIEKIEYLTGNGSPYNDPVGDVADGAAAGGGKDVIIWLRGGATYEWRTLNGGGWTLLNGNSAGGNITDSSGIVRTPISSQSTLITKAKNRFYTNTLSLGTAGTLAVDGTGNSYILGNVGIGTMSPGAKLHVVAAGGFGAEPIRAQSNSTFFSGVDAGGTVRFAINNDPGPTLNFYGYDNNWFNFMTVNNAGSRAVSFNAGNVGIGTTSPQSKLSIGTSGNSSYAVSVDTGSLGGIYGYGSNTGVYGYGGNTGIYGYGSNTGVYGEGSIGVYGYGSINGVYGYGSINGVYGESSNTGVNGYGSHIGVYGYGGTYDFYAGNTYGKSYFAGKVGIGATTFANQTRLKVLAGTGASVMEDWPSGWGGGIATWDIVGASAYLYGVSYRSDFFLKKNIQPINYDVLDRVLRLNPVSFYWKDERIDREKHFGFIAQEVEKIFPELVRKNSQGKKSLNYNELIPFLTKSIQEQQLQISASNTVLASYSTRLSSLEKDLNLTSTGDLKIVEQNSKFEIRNSKNDLIIRIAAFAEIIVGKIKAGLIETKKLIVDGVDIVKKISELEQKLEKQEQIIRNQQKEIEALKEIVGKLKK